VSTRRRWSLAGSSGVALIVVSDCGESIIRCDSGKPTRPLLSIPGRKTRHYLLGGFGLTQLEIPLETVEYLASICRRENVPLILDPAPARPLPRSLLESVAWFTPNETEAAFFVGGDTDVDNSPSPGFVAQRLSEKGVKRMVLKLGLKVR